MTDAHARRFEVLHRAYRAGAVTALYDGLTLAMESGTVPRWVIEGARTHLAATADVPMHRGRGGNARARALNDYVHFCRWDMVGAVRRHQQLCRDQRKEMEDLKIPPDEIEKAMANSRDFGHTWNDAYLHASRELAKSPAFGSPDAVKKSYHWLERHPESVRGFLPSWDTVRAVLRVDPHA